jgi:hypothetical protein
MFLSDTFGVYNFPNDIHETYKFLSDIFMCLLAPIIHQKWYYHYLSDHPHIKTMVSESYELP